MKVSLYYFTFLAFLLIFLHIHINAAPSGPLVKHLSSIIKWTKSTSKMPLSEDGNVVQFEEGYVVETVVEGNDLGFVPHSIRVSQDGELFAVDAENSNVVRITPPLSQYSRGRLVAGSFQGKTGHVDGKPSDARFDHPKGVTMDDKGNVYVADTSNLAIRKIGEAGVTTIAGGKSNIPGYRDGPSDNAKFSSDFDVIYLRPTCSLLVVDRGNAALRQISLNDEDCHYESNSISSADILMVVGAILVGYATGMLQQGFGSSYISRLAQQDYVEAEQNEKARVKKKHLHVTEAVKEEPEAGWPSFGQLLLDLSKFALESFGNILKSSIPFQSKLKRSKNGLTPLKDSLIMPEDQTEPPIVQKQKAPVPLSETRQHTPSVTEKIPEVKPHKLRSSSMRDPSLSTKHRSSRRQEYAEYYGSAETSPYVQVRTKTQKERSKHRQRDRSGEVKSGSSGVEPKLAEMKPVNYVDPPRYDPYNIRNKSGEAFRF
ncbi:hypothetical protein LIER_01370 [Lithospermum erythrorhizon]|uniref:NHL repeat-containing protein n=1 Tax=Lithospermum erythrorhizon TaxID=34254 RepID=A0AAV3NKN0_LITER